MKQTYVRRYRILEKIISIHTYKIELLADKLKESSEKDHVTSEVIV